MLKLLSSAATSLLLRSSTSKAPLATRPILSSQIASPCRAYSATKEKDTDTKETSAKTVQTEENGQSPEIDELGEQVEEEKGYVPKVAYSTKAFPSLNLDKYPLYVEREWWKRGNRMTFWATWRQLRDVKRRELIKETGATRMRMRALKWNTVLPQAIRDEAADYMNKMPMYSHPKLVLNMCMFTGRQRGKIKPYRVNRHIFRRLADHGQLSGVQRAMW